MIKEKKRIFLTGATGIMGMAGLKELIKSPDKYDITVLARKSKANIKKLAPYEKKGVKVVWGDLLDPNSVKRGVENVDIVLHLGGMVSPAAEHFPQKTLEVNVESMKIIASEVRKIEDKNPDREIKVVYIGSVSQYGSKMPPDHWGKVGDELKAARFDAYALSKILAERVLVEAGLKKWVSLRQTAILHPGLLKKAADPVTFHVPLKGAIEWVSVEDSGRLLERICKDDLPENFWNSYYNVGGGESFRLTNYEFEKGILKALGCPAPEKVFEPNWFAADNFHGIWFKDSDFLESILHFREGDSFEEVLGRLKKSLPFYYKLTSFVPAFVIKAFMKYVANSKELGTLRWVKDRNIPRIRAAWGSLEEYRRIPGWKNYDFEKHDKNCENESLEEINEGRLETKLQDKQCERGHKYQTSVILERGGHGCPYCLKEDTGV